MLTSTWSQILDLAQRTPSPHNVQPWKVRITSDTTCTVYLDLSRTLPKEDTTGSFITSGMVMYLEMLRYAAQNYQYGLTYNLLDASAAAVDNLQPFATVTIQYDQAIEPEFRKDIILKRRTSRLAQSPDVIPEEVQRSFQELVATHAATYGYTTDPSRIEDILACNIDALFHDLNRPSYHDEIVSWFRYRGTSSLRHKDGLDARCMNMQPTEYYLSAKLPFIFKIPGVKQVLAKRYRRILGATHCIGWLSGKFWAPQDAVVAGTLLMKFWLQLTQAGLYIHPFGNLVTNTDARQWLEQTTATEALWFVFRIGYTQAPPESYRRPVSDILIGEKE